MKSTSSGSGFLLHLLDARLVLVFLESLLERREVLVLLRLLHEPLEHAFEVEVTKRPVQVVRAADGAPWFHAGKALHRRAGDRPHEVLVRPHERLVEHLGEVVGRHSLALTLPLAFTLGAVFWILLRRVVAGLKRVAVFVEQVVLSAAQREVDLEHCLERIPVLVVLHERRGQCVLEGVAIAKRDVLHRFHCVEVLGEAHRQSGLAQLHHEAVQQFEDRAVVARWAVGRVRFSDAHVSSLRTSRRSTRSPSAPSRYRCDTSAGY